MPVPPCLVQAYEIDNQEDRKEKLSEAVWRSADSVYNQNPGGARAEGEAIVSKSYDAANLIAASRG